MDRKDFIQQISMRVEYPWPYWNLFNNTNNETPADMGGVDIVNELWTKKEPLLEEFTYCWPMAVLRIIDSMPAGEYTVNTQYCRFIYYETVDGVEVRQAGKYGPGDATLTFNVTEGSTRRYLMLCAGRIWNQNLYNGSSFINQFSIINYVDWIYTREENEGLEGYSSMSRNFQYATISSTNNQTIVRVDWDTHYISETKTASTQFKYCFNSYKHKDVVIDMFNSSTIQVHGGGRYMIINGKLIIKPNSATEYAVHGLGYASELSTRKCVKIYGNCTYLANECFYYGWGGDILLMEISSVPRIDAYSFGGYGYCVIYVPDALLEETRAAWIGKGGIKSDGSNIKPLSEYVG